MARIITDLHPEAQAKATQLVELCKRAGYIIKITDCVRSKKEQDSLYAQGRTTSGDIVTNVKYPYSMHNWGIAFDFCRNDGKGAYYDSDGFFSKVGQIGKSIGLEWGGDWTSFVDKPHFQLKGYESATKMVKLYGTPEKFMKTWVKDLDQEEVYDMPTIKKGSKGTAVKIIQCIVGAKPDGDFGKETHSLVRQFQRDHGLKVDGIVGDNTWRVALESV